MSKQYNNPILYADFSDPDVIRHGDDYFMVSSSFNFVPSVPVLHSKNLVEWEYIGCVLESLPFEKYNSVIHGGGAWAPSIRLHNGWFYCIIPFPDEGVFVSKTRNPFDGWEKPVKLIDGRGIIDPCPIWTDDGCYLAVAFAKSRVGFNSKIGIYKVSDDLTENLSGDYKIVYDGTNNNPTIEGPKLYYFNDYYYILAPAGGVKTGWQVALRSKDIYGPYESKIVLMQGDSAINGPHQGALVDTPNGKNQYFIHFQYRGAYGRIIHLQPVIWHEDWPLMGSVKDNFIAGSPISQGNFPVDISTNFSVRTCFDFTCNQCGLWQTPANPKKEWYKLDNGLDLYCQKSQKLCDLPSLLCQKIYYENFVVNTKLKLFLQSVGDQIGITVMGKEYAFLAVRKNNNCFDIVIGNGSFDGQETSQTIGTVNGNEQEFSIIGKRLSDGNLSCDFAINGKTVIEKFIAKGGAWVGAHIGIFAMSDTTSNGKAKFLYFNQIEK